MKAILVSIVIFSFLFFSACSLFHPETSQINAMKKDKATDFVLQLLSEKIISASEAADLISEINKYPDDHRVYIIDYGYGRWGIRDAGALREFHNQNYMEGRRQSSRQY